MTFLYPHFLWIGIPILLYVFHKKHPIVAQVHMIILLFILLSLSRPISKQALIKTKLQSKTLIIALDVSYSMRAKDIQPNRYHFAVQTIHALLDLHPLDTVMLFIFTTNPLLLSPPTTDHELINIALESLNPDFILTKGTSLQSLFRTLNTLPYTQAQNLLLITDGGEEQESTTLKKLFQTTQLSLTTLALGTKEGSTLQSTEGKLLKDKQNHLVISAINPMLSQLTASLKGHYLTASSSPKHTAIQISQALKDIPSISIEKMQHRYLEYYQIPLFLALVLFFMLHTRAIKYLLILFIFLGVEIEASFLDDYYLHKAYQSYAEQDFKHTYTLLQKIDSPSLQKSLLLANTYYKKGAFKTAIKTYQKIHSRSVPIKQSIYYNIANAYVQLGLYEEAKQYYIKSLQLRFDAESLHNLSLIWHIKIQHNNKHIKVGPQSQNHTQSQKYTATEKKNSPKKAAQSGAGGGGKDQKKKHSKTQLPHKPSASKHTQKHPLSSKVYEHINKGYIYEQHPW